MTRKKHVIAIVIAIVFVTVIIFSSAYIVAEADHNCSGEHCPICYQIEICQNTIKALTLYLIVTAISVAIAYFTKWSEVIKNYKYSPTTLIKQKVKLSY